MRRDYLHMTREECEAWLRDSDAERAECARADELAAEAEKRGPRPVEGYWPSLTEEHHERWRTRRGWREEAS